MLVLSGGVSVGKYDLVEQVLRDLGAEFFFDAVAIRPGKPAVFGWCRGKPVFGLPGNPVSTMVTFELFVAPAIDMLERREGAAVCHFAKRSSQHALSEKAPLAHFLPARVSWASGDASGGDDLRGKVREILAPWPRELLSGRASVETANDSKPANGWTCCRDERCSSIAGR